jgi:hypothetical protein
MFWKKVPKGSEVKANPEAQPVGGAAARIPSDVLDKARETAWNLASSGQLVTDGDIQNFMRKHGITTEADQAVINDAIWKAKGGTWG